MNEPVTRADLEKLEKDLQKEIRAAEGHLGARTSEVDERLGKQIARG